MGRLEKIRERLNEWGHDAGAYRGDAEWLLERVDELAELHRHARGCDLTDPDDPLNHQINEALSKLDE